MLRPWVSPLLRQAAIEGFYSNVRSLIEFLGHRTNRRDSSAKDIDPSWQMPSDAATLRNLEDHWQAATKHAMHFTEDRTGFIVDVDQQKMEDIADHVLTVWDQFAVHPPEPLQRRGHFAPFA